ncbi:TPA: hypothetical protein JD250_04230 [Proteus mirabilis]|nr:hypothetical protein [Proteus mirabilis]HAU5533355.1 hypothetical protein [Proteus mirabilis]HAU5536893.1 hypothetical protein [Proteus mirabilis]HAU5540811.1 hypothetical protein [Proteus mirabilis]HAU5571369.1 hypothetical protein [Proteus mirabilis]
MSNNNDLITIQKKEIMSLYSQYCCCLEDYNNNLCSIEDIHNKATDFFNYVEQSVSHNNSIEGIKESDWNQWIAETCIEVLELIVTHYKCYRNEMNNDLLKPGPTAFAGIQRMVMDFDKDKAKEIKELFKNNNLPTYGFDKKRKFHMTKTHEKIAAFSFGIIFIVTILIIALFTPYPTSFQYTIFRIILSGAMAGFVSFIPGFIELRISNLLRAGGAIAVFIFVYYFAPAAL